MSVLPTNRPPTPSLLPAHLAEELGLLEQKDTRPIHTAVRAAEPSEHTSNEEAIQSAIETIRSNPQSLQTQDEDGLTPLNLALAYGLDQIVETIFEVGKMPPEARPAICSTLLFRAIVLPQKGLTTIKTLLRVNADPNAFSRDNTQRRPIHFTTHLTDRVASEFIEALVDANADPNARDINGYTPLHYYNLTADAADALIKNKANPEIPDSSNGTPLHFAATHGNKDVAKTLLDQGASPNKRDDNGTTPLHCAVSFNHLDLVKLLLSRGASLESHRRVDETFLHMATMTARDTPNEDFTAVIQELLAAGEDPKAQDQEGRTPLDLLVSKEQRALLDTDAVAQKATSLRYKAATVAFAVATPIIWALSARYTRCEIEASQGLAPEESGFFGGFFGATETASSTLSWGDCFLGN